MRWLMCCGVLLSGASTGLAEEYFGKFSEPLAGIWNPWAKEATFDAIKLSSAPNSTCGTSEWQDWNTFTLTQDFSFSDPNGFSWTTPKGHTVNGASIPRWAWTIIGSPFTGPYFPASVIHDHYVCERTRTAHDTHRNFYYGMRANGVPWAKAQAMYWAVSVYTDWELTAEGVVASEAKLDLSDGRTASVFANELKEVAAAFELEEIRIQRGEANEADYDFSFVEDDAASFRSVLSGELPAASYDGLAGDFGSTEVFLWTPEIPTMADFNRTEIKAADWDLGVDYKIHSSDKEITIESKGDNLVVYGLDGKKLDTKFGTILEGEVEPIRAFDGKLNIDERSMPWFAVPISN